VTGKEKEGDIGVRDKEESGGFKVEKGRQKGRGILIHISPITPVPSP
jgi:hypothetical protein